MKKKDLYILFFLILLTACNHVNYESNIPDAAVSLTFNIYQDAPELDVVGGFKEFTKPPKIGEYVGYGGVLIFHDFNGNFDAFDMACPYENNPNIRVHASMLGNAVCDSCGSVFNIMYGGGLPISGPSPYALKAYHLTFSNGYIRVYN